MDDVASSDGFDLPDFDLRGLHRRVPKFVLILSLYPHRFVVEHTRVVVLDDRHDLRSGFCVVVGSRHFNLV
jgi:hypothetical protein